MDTYGDMVTLLLTFFVMLYSMSSLDAQKWEIFVRSIYPDGSGEQQIEINGTIDPDGEINGTQGEEPKTDEEKEPDINTLYLTIAELLSSNSVDGVTVSRGNGYTFVSFDDNVFFNGNESVLTKSGKEVLALFCDAIAPVEDEIAKINIMAHTAQGDPNKPNTPRTDRMLSAMRGSEVCIFIQERGAAAPEKLVNISYGQFRPIASNDTSEGRAKNRRVEILLVDEGAQERSLAEYFEEYKSGVNEATTVVSGEQSETETESKKAGFTETEDAMPEIQASMMQTSADAQDEAAGEGSATIYE